MLRPYLFDQSSFCPNSAMFEEWPGMIFAAGFKKCAIWLTAMHASANLLLRQGGEPALD